MNASFEYHCKYILVISGIILFSSAVIIGLNFFSIRVLSSIRAYVKGESEYSKAQKDATRYLIDFIQTSETESYRMFKQELAVPISDSIARVGLQKGKPEELVRQAFLKARNHPADVDNLVWLFKNFQNVWYFKQGVNKWTVADRYIGELDRIGEFIFKLKTKRLDPDVKTALIVNVNTINRRLSNNQQAFSNILGEASRAIAWWLLIMNVCFVLLILSSAGVFARNMIRQLVESRKLIIAQNSVKDEFLSIASHELKTPLTSMKASLQILERFARNSPESAKIFPFVVNANKQVNRLTDLVKELLDVTRIQSGKLFIEKKPLLLKALIKEVLIETTQASKHEYIIEHLAEGYVHADNNRIYQVIDNLLSNAAKYSGECDPIYISSCLVNGHLKVYIKDCGAGIEKNKVPFVFERFYRIEESKHAVQGLGLGLYICKEIIQNHGGEIGVESRVNNGSTFWFSLPVLTGLPAESNASNGFSGPVIPVTPF